jgi:hypothetical protein
MSKSQKVLVADFPYARPEMLRRWKMWAALFALALILLGT